MELNDVIRTTFAAREYTGEDVPDKLIYDILEVARFAPSGGNRQGNRVIVVRNPETRAEFGKLTIPAAKRYIAQSKAGESPWNAVTPTKVSDAEIEATEPSPHLTGTFSAAAAVLVFCVDLKVVASTDQLLDRVGVISGGSIYPFVWNVLLLLRQAGFGGTITTLAVAQEPELKALLRIPDDHAVAAVMPIGKPVKQLTKLKRLPVEAIATRESFDGITFTM
ncbi:MAG: nitroreductase family protein [Alphaproteobacteria bacterium]